MSKKLLTLIGVITGTVFLIALLTLSIWEPCPTEWQNKMFVVFLGLSAAAYSATILGSINIRYKQILTAGGGFAVFILIYATEPTTLSDYKKCSKEASSLTGIVYFNNKPIENISIQDARNKQSSITDSYGSFSMPLEIKEEMLPFKLRFINTKIQLDSLILLEEVKDFYEIKIRSFCVQCTHTDSTGYIVRQKKVCSASKEFCVQYELGYSNAGSNQSLQTNCIYSEQ